MLFDTNNDDMNYDFFNYVALTTELKSKYKIKSNSKQDLSILDFLN